MALSSGTEPKTVPVIIESFIICNYLIKILTSSSARKLSRLILAYTSRHRRNRHHVKVKPFRQVCRECGRKIGVNAKRIYPSFVFRFEDALHLFSESG